MPLCVFQVLNEVVVDRGPSSYLSNVDLFLDGHLITTVQGDGEWTENLCSSLGEHQCLHVVNLVYALLPLFKRGREC